MPNLAIRSSWFFYGVLILHAIPVLALDYFVTGDGPCHFYNSRIIYEWLFNGQAEFFRPFFVISDELVPNWTTNFIQVPLLAIFSPKWAEKVFFLLYLAAFSFGFRRLLQVISPQAVWAAPLGVLFAWHHTVLMGFTNNAWSVALSFWLLSFWIQAFHARGRMAHAKYFLLLSITMLGVWFSHPMGWFYSLIGMATTTTGFVIFLYRRESLSKAAKTWAWHTLRGILVALPSIVLMYRFYAIRNWKAETNRTPAGQIFEQLLSLKSLINYSSSERWLVAVLSALIFLLFFGVLYRRIKARTMYAYDGLLLFFIVMVWILFDQPRSITGGLEVGIRLGIFPALCMLMWMGTFDLPDMAKRLVGWGALLISAGLLFTRFPHQKAASALATEVVSCTDHIRPQSTLLALNYDWSGRDVNGKIIGDKIWLFGHIDTYLGTSKPLIISDNYEANYWYFPVIERWETNMYKQTDDEQRRNFDHRPPCANILDYTRRTGGKLIDYVLLVGYRDEFADHECTRSVFSQLDSAYIEVFRSKNERAILYKKK